MDLVIRAAVVFFFIFFLTRVVGRRQLSDLEPFDFILLVVLGALVQQGITQSDESVPGTLTWTDRTGAVLRSAASAAAGCPNWPLRQGGRQSVSGEGALPAPMMLVGGQPGEPEEVAGHPVVGPSGVVLDSALAEAGIYR